MTATQYSNLNAGLAKVIPLSYFPTPQQFYGEATGQEADQPQWQGGELILYTTNNQIFIQTATSGATAVWKRLSSAFATTTSTSTSSTTSSSSSTSTSTSTSSSTSTSTSTSSTTTSGG